MNKIAFVFDTFMFMEYNIEMAYEWSSESLGLVL